MLEPANWRSVFSTPLFFLLRLLAFWLLFFAAFRLWFVLWFSQKWFDKTNSVWPAFWEALPLDFSTAGYLLVLPTLLFFIGIAGNKGLNNISEKAISTFNTLIISVLVAVFGANVFIYEEWQTLLNNRALEYLRSPAALTDSMSWGFILGSVVLYFSLVWLFWKVYLKTVGREIFRGSISKWWLASFPAVFGVIFLMIRGGLGVMPINESAVYFSGNLFNNHAATNAAWHLLHSMVETRAEKNPFVFFEKEKAESICNELKPNVLQKSSPENLTDTRLQKPNLVFLILESHTAQIIEEIGQEKGVCPNFSKLSAEGVLFTNIFSSGYRTDQGLVAILSGYPSQPDQSVVLQEEKSSKLPSVPKLLAQNGYQTAYLYGGELTFANIGVYLANQGFQKIISEKDFSGEEKRQKWGADDETVLLRAVSEFSKMEEPFFGTVMTLSLHPPYDVPFQSHWANSPKDRDRFLNAAAFVDHAIGQFFEKARQTAWFENTVFVLVADHGATHPGNMRMDEPNGRHIPLLFYGEGILKSWRGRKIDVFGNHHDIPATVFANFFRDSAIQPMPNFHWSKDLIFQIALSKRKNKNQLGFAYYSNEDGLGWVNADGGGFMKFQTKDWEFFRGRLDSAAQNQAKAWLQVFYDDYLNL